MFKRTFVTLLTIATLLQGRLVTALASSVDVIRPVITGPTALTLGASHAITTQQLATLLVLSDNVSLLTYEDLTVTESSCNLDRPILGACSVTLTVTDDAGNVSFPFIIDVLVVDDTKPVITGPHAIYKHPDVSLILDDVLELFTVTDNDSPDIALQLLSDAYTGNGDTPGDYAIRFKAVDNFGNAYYHKLDIVVDDDLPPALLIIDADETARMIVHIDQVITKDDMITALEIADFITSEPHTTSWDLDEYSDFSAFIGNYDMSLFIDLPTGVRESLDFTIQISDQMAVTIEPSKNILQIIGDGFAWFWGLLKGIVDWFVGLIS